MVPQPVKAVLLVFPITQALDDENKEEDAQIAKEGLSLIDPSIIWIKQTVRSFFRLFFLYPKMMSP
jgi:ubiquitin carboxyl-terminal hydrolase L3